MSSYLLPSLTILFHSINSWNYADLGPSKWPELFEECGGINQSPIDIPTEPPTICTQSNSTNLQLNWNYNKTELNYIVSNSGKSLYLTPININKGSKINTFETLTNNKNTIATLPNIHFNTYQSNENKKYCLDGLHFHWAETEFAGSEHTFDGKYSALELHYLHYSCDYPSLTDALNAYLTNKSLKDKYVLSAIGVLFDVGEPNPALQKVLDNYIISQISSVGGMDSLSNKKLSNIYTSFLIDSMLPKNKEFISYHGSITAPPCLENVRWNVLKEKITVSREQLIQFRRLLTKDNKNLMTNHRPIQSNTNELFYCNAQINNIENINGKHAHVLVIVIIAGSIIFFFICLIGICKYNKKKINGRNMLKNSISTNDESQMNVSMRKLDTNDKYACYQ